MARPRDYGAEDALALLSEHLTRWRKLLGLTQETIAQRARVSRSVIMKLEAGDGGVSIESLMRVLGALHVRDRIVDALDPLETEFGRSMADEILPQRVRQRKSAR